MENSVEFRALYYAILHKQTEIALREVCRQLPSVVYGHERLEDKVEMYLDDAKVSPELENFLEEWWEIDPPARLIDWLNQKVKEYREKTETGNSTKPDSEGNST